MNDHYVRRIDVVEAQDRFFELLDAVAAGEMFDLMKEGIVIGRLQAAQAVDENSSAAGDPDKLSDSPR